MTPADRPEFARILTGLAAMKPNARLTPEVLDLWWNSMQHWSIENFRAAGSHLVTNVEFMPSPFHFEQLRNANRPTAGEAWQRALKHAAGAYRSNPTCGDSVVDRVVAMLGGYVTIGMCDFSKLGFMERRFADHYAELQDADDIRAAVPQLTAPPNGLLLE